MYVIMIIALSLFLFYVVFLAAIFVTALLIAKNEIRKHHERWRFS